MKITIDDQRKIFAVQKEFSEMFPFLKLGFYAKSNRSSGAPSKKLMKRISKTIAECRTIHSSGAITIEPQMTIGELEQAFRDIYGLSIEIFRKAKDNFWLGIAEYTGQTLEKQNVEGMELANYAKAN